MMDSKAAFMVLAQAVGYTYEVRKRMSLGVQYWKTQEVRKRNRQILSIAEYGLNRRVPSGTHGGVRGWGQGAPSSRLH